MNNNNIDYLEMNFTLNEDISQYYSNGIQILDDKNSTRYSS